VFEGKRLPTNSPSKIHMKAAEIKILLLDRYLFKSTENTTNEETKRNPKKFSFTIFIVLYSIKWIFKLYS
jgi:hypothetical protein